MMRLIPGAGKRDMLMRRIEGFLTKRAYLWISLIIICVGMVLCGFDFFNNKVIMDTEERRIYQVSDPGALGDAFEKNKDRYNGSCFLLYGNVVNKKSSYKEFDLETDGGGKGITCSITDKQQTENIRNLKEGDRVKVYGKVSYGLTGRLNVKIDKVENAGDEAVSYDTYTLIGGQPVRKSGMAEKRFYSKNKDRSLEARFYIPSEWKAVEHDVVEEKLGSMEGYQYCLNNLGKREAYAESLFISYYDKSDVDINDRDKDKLIEEAIIRDILYPKDENKVITGFPLKSIKTYYGAKYKYYRSSYKTATGEKYSVEMIFQETENGFAVVTYVYKHENHIDDVMLVLRLMEAG